METPIQVRLPSLPVCGVLPTTPHPISVVGDQQTLRTRAIGMTRHSQCQNLVKWRAAGRQRDYSGAMSHPLTCVGAMARLLPLVACLLFALPCPAQDCDSCPIVPEHRPSWVFKRSTFSHDPATGARVAQYDRIPPVEALDDPRAVTSSYRRTRSAVRGADGSVDSTYQVQSWGNGRGGIDAEWERFHDAWRQSITAGGYFHQNAPVPYGTVYGYPGGGYGPGFGGYQYPNGFPPRYGVPPYGPTPHDGPHFRQRYPRGE